jgi:glycosyltransferase involved in cell wall biosynthesis
VFGLRVIHVINGLGTGGAEAVLYRVATHPSSTEHEIVCLEDRDWYSDKLEAHGIKVHHVDWHSVGAPAAIIRLHRLIRDSQADVVQTWMYRSNLFGGISARIAGKPVLWNIRCSTHESLRLGSQLLARAGGFVARWVPDMVVNCSAVSRDLHAPLGYESVEIAVIPNGYDRAVFHPDETARAATREALGVGDDCFLVGAIGRWDPQKGYPVLLRALRLLNDSGVPLRLLLVGRGLDPSNAKLTRIIEQNGVTDLVAAIGERSDIPDIARALDLHVLPSVTEAFPNVVAETMLSATPNVSTDVGDAKLIVGDTGWIVPVDDPDRLASAVKEARDEWANSPERWRARRETAHKRIADNFSLEQMVEAYENVWRHVAARASSSERKPGPAAVPSPAVIPVEGNSRKFTVSVVIPMYNKECAVESTLESVLAQTRSPDELIIIDDGSTDHSAEIAQRLLSTRAGEIPWRIVSQKNAGEGAARNRGAAEAASDYIAFMDADDEWLPEYLSEMEKLALSFPSATVLTIRNSRRNARGAIVPAPSPLGSSFFGLVDRPIEAYRRGNGLLNSSSVAIRRDAWKRCGGFHTGAPIGEDVTMWLVLGLSETFAHSGRALSIWRDEYSGVMARKSSIAEQLRYFLGTAEGRLFLTNADLVRFLSTNIIVQIGAYSLIGNTDIRQELRRLSSALPFSSRLKCWAASMIPPSGYRAIAWWRRRSRELA